MTTEMVNTEIPRDRHGRPMVMPPTGPKKRIPYRRTTTFVDCLDNNKGLENWSMRCVAYGISQRPDLVLAAAALDPTLALSGHHPQKKKLDQIADQAKEFARSSAAATTGTALHDLTERLDLGQKLGHIPNPYGADLDAYRQATVGIEWIDIESFRVHDAWQVAGTADRIGLHHGRPRIFDIKTGSIDYPHKMAMQLAMYARSLPYDIATDQRGEDPQPIDLNTGVIIHLPAGQGRCDLYEIDIAKGWGACQVARQVWRWRGEKDLLHKVNDPRRTVWEKSNADPQHISWTDAALGATTLDGLRGVWREAHAHDALTDDFRAAARKRSEQLAAKQ